MHQNEAVSVDEVVVNEIVEPSKIKTMTRLNFAATGTENWTCANYCTILKYEQIVFYCRVARPGLWTFV